MGEESSSSSSLTDQAQSDAIELDIPIFIELKQSSQANDLGAFSRTKLNPDQFMGSYKGKHRKSMSQCVDQTYVWTILSSRQIPLFYIDATDPNDSNWLRFIRSTNDANKYNVICMQQNQQINYFTFKEINEGDELLTYLPGKKKKTKTKSYTNTTYKIYDEKKVEPEPEIEETPLEQIQEETQEDDEEEEENNDEDIQFKIQNEEIKKKDDYFLQFNFNIKSKMTKKFTKRQLVKCDLCSYTLIVDSGYDLDKIIKTHVVNEHLILKKDVNPIEDLCKFTCNDLVKQVETGGTENTFNLYFDFKSNSKLDLLNYKLKCVYCECEFDQFDTDLANEFFKHLKTHKSSILEDNLVIRVDEVTDHDLDCVNWSDYFRLSFKDGRFPYDKKSTKTWTCHMCKKQFDQRIDLSKHQCIELNLKLLKKKKELRKKKWKETHWKRKIDLSYVETTSFTQISSNICDNLAFCIDGTSGDLKSYSKEVKDYLTTELNNETQTQMFLKCLFPDNYKQIISEIPNLTESNAGKLIEQFLINKSNLYFTNDLTCHQCSENFNDLNEYYEHVVNKHENKLEFDNTPLGYLSCDPIAYLFNLYWDRRINVKCTNCNLEFRRDLIKSHVQECKNETNKICTEILNDLITDFKVAKKRTANDKLDEQEVKKRSLETPNRRGRKSSPETKFESPAVPVTRTSSRLKIKVEKSPIEMSPPTPVKKESKSDLVSIKIINNRKVHTCDKCDLEFTSNNSVIRHQEKSCLRIKVISVETKSKLKSKQGEIKKKCPICGQEFTRTHQLSIHIYRQHKTLLGSAHESATPEAKRLNEEQMSKSNEDSVEVYVDDDDDDASWILNESTGDEANVSNSTDSPSKKRKLLNSTI